jgi:phytoene synthase
MDLPGLGTVPALAGVVPICPCSVEGIREESGRRCWIHYKPHVGAIEVNDGLADRRARPAYDRRMSSWNQSLDAAGVRASYLAARLLLPKAVLPHVVAATAVMHHGDNLLDTGPKPQRVAAWASWEQEVRKALESGVSDDPLIRTLLHTTAAYPRLREVVEEYLATATAELEFAGFATEADYQAYVDAYSLPAFMLVASLLKPEHEDVDFRAGCRR